MNHITQARLEGQKSLERILYIYKDTDVYPVLLQCFNEWLNDYTGQLLEAVEKEIPEKSITVQIPCPDGIVGSMGACAVYHTRQIPDYDYNQVRQSLLERIQEAKTNKKGN